MNSIGYAMAYFCWRRQKYMAGFPDFCTYFRWWRQKQGRVIEQNWGDGNVRAP